MNREFRLLKLEARKLFRDVMRTVYKLEGHHQRIWRDYARLKFEENAETKDLKRIRRLISSARDEVEWVQKILREKKDDSNSRPPSSDTPPSNI